MSKSLGGIIGRKYKTSSWHLDGFPDDGSNIGSIAISIKKDHKSSMCRASNMFLDLIVEKYEKMLSQSRMERNWRECGELAGLFGNNHPLLSAHIIRRHYTVDPILLPSGYHGVALSLQPM